MQNRNIDKQQAKAAEGKSFKNKSDKYMVSIHLLVT